MKHKLYILVALTLIAFVAITSYTPQTAQAETLMQEDPESEPEEITFTDKGEVTYAEDFAILTEADSVDLSEDFADPDADDQINSDKGYDFFSAVGINFVPHDDYLTWFNRGNGCLASNYSGATAKTYTLPINVTYGAKAVRINFTYWNNKDNPGGQIEVTLFRKKFNSLETQMVQKYLLDKTGGGQQFTAWAFAHTFDTKYWVYWIEFKLPNGTANREFCSFTLDYQNPPLFPMALPVITNNK